MRSGYSAVKLSQPGVHTEDAGTWNTGRPVKRAAMDTPR
ncbi:unnamed protein product, partial [Staurois parvus]